MKTTMIKWHNTKTDGLPKKSGKYLVCDNYNYISTERFSARYRKFNVSDDTDRNSVSRYGADYDWWAEIPNIDDGKTESETPIDQIEEMAELLTDALGRETVDKFIEDKDGNLVRIETYSLYDIATELYNAGYGDINAFANKIKKCIHYCENISQPTDDCLCEDIDEIVNEMFGEE